MMEQLRVLVDVHLVLPNCMVTMSLKNVFTPALISMGNADLLMLLLKRVYWFVQSH